MKFLLDTNVLSEIRKGKHADTQVMMWWRHVEAEDLYLSVICLGEIRYGIELKRKRDFTQSKVLESWLETTISQFGDRILPITHLIADQWGQQSINERLADADGLIAATAIVHDLAVVTRNTKDFIRTGAMVINPWEFVA